MGQDVRSPRGPRCIALVGPFQSGKTTLLEAILARTGAIPRAGSVSYSGGSFNTHEGSFDFGGHTRKWGYFMSAAATKTIAVIMLNFSNDTSQPWTASTVRGVVFDNPDSVNQYYQDTSNGQLTLSGDVFGWYTIPSDNSGCAYGTWGSQAYTAATNAGVNLSSYQYVVYAFPSASSCGVISATPSPPAAAPPTSSRHCCRSSRTTRG